MAASDFDAVFIQREAALVGPPYSELILGAWKGLPIIFDFDDAIWELNLAESAHPLAARMLKSPGKCWYTMRRATCVIAGSSYLAARAREVSDQVQIVPTVVSAKEWTTLPCRIEGEFRAKGKPRIGWIGTHTTASQLELVAPALRQLRADGYAFELRVVGAAEGFRLDGVELEARPWRLDQEIEEFRSIDMGLAPMFAEPVYEGKCGFKQLQYMAVGVPFVSSLVGGARDFVVDGQVGLVAHDAGDWYRQIKALLDSQELRQRLSENGLKLVKERYSLEVQGPRVARIVEEALSASR
jgi:glycosyltransferase involved in cell wall biosynthesis